MNFALPRRRHSTPLCRTPPRKYVIRQCPFCDVNAPTAARPAVGGATADGTNGRRSDPRGTNRGPRADRSLICRRSWALRGRAGAGAGEKPPAHAPPGQPCVTACRDRRHLSHCPDGRAASPTPRVKSEAGLPQYLQFPEAPLSPPESTGSRCLTFLQVLWLRLLLKSQVISTPYPRVPSVLVT